MINSNMIYHKLEEIQQFAKWWKQKLEKKNQRKNIKNIFPLINQNNKIQYDSNKLFQKNKSNRMDKNQMKDQNIEEMYVNQRFREKNLLDNIKIKNNRIQRLRRKSHISTKQDYSEINSFKLEQNEQRNLKFKNQSITKIRGLQLNLKLKNPKYSTAVDIQCKQSESEIKLQEKLLKKESQQKKTFLKKNEKIKALVAQYLLKQNKSIQEISPHKLSKNISRLLNIFVQVPQKQQQIRFQNQTQSHKENRKQQLQLQRNNTYNSEISEKKSIQKDQKLSNLLKKMQKDLIKLTGWEQQNKQQEQNTYGF